MDRKLDYDKIEEFYSKTGEVWPSGNLWYSYVKKKINNFIKKHIVNGYVLNVGSGGNTYGLKNKMCHVDIVEKNISNYDDYAVANAENLPFQSLKFDVAICVGDVINYCDAKKAINELYRVIKEEGQLIIEFENSCAYEYIRKDFYCADRVITNLEYMNEIINQYLYSYNYIVELLEISGFKIRKRLSIHIISGLVSNWILNDNIACVFSFLDFALNKLNNFRKHGSNIVFLCEKVK